MFETLIRGIIERIDNYANRFSIPYLPKLYNTTRDKFLGADNVSGALHIISVLLDDLLPERPFS